ncbi:MAG: hypothetical protein ABSF23_11690 [Terracidiphilus sp.]|jgi:hypothetical protein
MNEPAHIEPIDRDPLAPRSAAPHVRAMGLPLPRGSSRRASDAGDSPARNVPPATPGRALPGVVPGRAVSGAAPAEESSALHRAINVARTLIPVVQRLLPLIDGNVGTVISNFIAPRPHPPAPPPQPKVDLTPLEDSLNEIQAQHRNLRDQLAEQNTSLKRVEDQLEMVREATDRNTLEQQELLEDLKSFSTKIKVAAIIALSLVGIGIVLNVILFLHIQRVLP